jgi:hypothetical protein
MIVGQTTIVLKCLGKFREQRPRDIGRRSRGSFSGLQKGLRIGPEVGCSMFATRMDEHWKGDPFLPTIEPTSMTESLVVLI